MLKKKGDDAALAKIAQAPEPYREIGERLHRIIRDRAPSLEAEVRWGIPFYMKGGEDVCYIKTDKNYIVFGFGETNNPTVEEGSGMHPVAWTITSLSEADEVRIGDLVAKAAG